MIGEPDAGKTHVRFDEGVHETCGSVTRLCLTLTMSLAYALYSTGMWGFMARGGGFGKMGNSGRALVRCR